MTQALARCLLIVNNVNEHMFFSMKQAVYLFSLLENDENKH